jgi:ornithine cyclodeaminase/alanine dehydrogenase-like protein (mu-crystallin family)
MHALWTLAPSDAGRAGADQVNDQPATSGLWGHRRGRTLAVCTADQEDQDHIKREGEPGVLALSRQDLKRLVSMRDAIDLVKIAFRDLSAGHAVVPLRTSLEVKPGSATTLLMPAYLPDVPALGLKAISIFQENARRGLPIGNAMVCMIDPETGVPAALLNGAYLTALRTGAVSGASAELMAREDARHLVIIGAGTQGVTQAAAVCASRPIERVTVVYRHESSWQRYREAIAADWPDLLDRLEGTTDAEAAVRAADIVCVATTSRTPVFEDAWIKPGTHVSGVGSFTPQMQEVPAPFVVRARVVVDMKEHALEEAGDLIIPIREGLLRADDILGELGELVAGTLTARTSELDVTFFKSVGNEVQDIAVAHVAVSRAMEQGVGQEIDLG